MRKQKRGRAKTKGSKSRNKRPEKYLITLRKKLGIITMQEAKSRAMTKAYDACKGDAILAAALLGIGKTSLYRFLNTRR
jgi:transcriptional regulator of acetoin/glycerol metabolism